MTLIERLENAKWGSQGMSNEVARSFGWLNRGNSRKGEWFAPEDVRDGKPVICQLHGTDIWRLPPDFTRDLQRALSLLPEGCGYSINVDRHPTPYSIDRSQCQVLIFRERDGVIGRGDAATPALALCAAALEARDHE